MDEVRLVINMHATGAAGEFAAEWAPHYDVVNAEPGCRQYELFRSTVNPDNLALLELWSDRAAFDAHWQLQRTRPSIGAALIGEPHSRTTPGREGVEIYWERAEHVLEPSSQLWVRR